MNQTYKNTEIIVVDNHSDDRTKEIARRYTDAVYDKGPERSAQRNYGMLEKSCGQYLMYLDADMILSERVIESCMKKMQEGNIALYISEIVMGDSFWSKVRRFERSFYDGTVIDCVRFITKEFFVRASGFDVSMTGPEDWDLDKKLRIMGKVDMVTEPIYHNEAEFDMKKYLQKKSYYAKSFSTYSKKWGNNDPDVKKQLGFLYRFFWVFTENGKWVKLITHPILALAMYFLRVLVGVKYTLVQYGK